MTRNRRKSTLALLLSLVMVFSLLPGFAFAAEGDPVLVSQKSNDTPQPNDDLHMRKSLYRNADGTYDIVIESWATGEVEHHEVEEAVPTDFVLVLDQSGSMTERDMPATYNPVLGPWTPNRVMSSNQTLYYKVTNADGTTSYYQVACKDKPTSGLNSISPQATQISSSNGYARYNNNDIYYKDADGSVYRVRADILDIIGLYRRVSLTYIDAYGNEKSIASGASGFWGLINHTFNNNLYTLAGNNHGYGLYYKDGAGTEQQVADSQTVSATDTDFYSRELYTTTGENQTRLEALKNAVSGFVSTVEAKAAEDGVNHRIAIVGFASDNSQNTTQNPAWENTELLTGVNVSGTNGRQYNQISETDYRNALQDVRIDAGRTDLDKAVNAIAAKGGTQAQYGFYMAENILEKRQVTTYVNEAGQTANRNTVVLFFTDGHPGNYDYDDTIAAANTVVDAAKSVKQNQWNTKVFSVGIFADGDDQPLTYAVRVPSSDSQKRQLMSRPNYIGDKTINGVNYYMFRGNQTTQTPYNDTIADYMTCVSSKYPNASNFLTHAGGTADTGAKTNSRGAENQDHVDYYMRVTDASGLQRAFETIANSIDTSSTSANVNGDAVLRDTVYLEDFDVSGASVEAKSVKVEMVDGQVVETGEPGTANPTVTETVKTNGRLSVTGFDYSDPQIYTTTSSPGEKLVVTIKNVEPKVGGHLWSNSGDASIFPDADSTNAVLGVASPEENIARVTKVIDFNAQMILSPNMKRFKNVGTIKNGAYSIDGNGNFIYQLLPGVELKESMEDPTNLTMNGVDVALALSNDVVWTEYTAIPASSVYFDDDLLDTTLNVGDGSGFNEGVTVSPASENLAKGQHTYTFYGTGIDVYCTTTDQNAGTISAKLTKPDGTKLYENMYNYSTETRYNVPTVFFHDLPQGQYMLTLTAYGSSNYKLDGMRVYNPVSDQTLYNPVGDQTFNDNDARSEQYGAYVNLRGALINAENEEKVTIDDTQAAVGVLFVDNPEFLTEDVAEIDLKTGEPVLGPDGQPKMTRLYTDAFAAYKDLGPKNEIYLDTAKAAVAADEANGIEAQPAKEGQAITFTLTPDAFTAAQAGHLWIGLSTPEAANGGLVSINGATNTITVKNQVDQYYKIEKEWIDSATRNVTIKNAGDALIAITNLKITGVEKFFNAAAQTESSDEGAVPESFEDLVSMVFEPVTMQTVKVAANDGVDPDAVKDNWDDNAVTAQTILKALFELLLNTLSNLFSGLGNW